MTCPTNQDLLSQRGCEFFVESAILYVKFDVCPKAKCWDLCPDQSLLGHSFPFSDIFEFHVLDSHLPYPWHDHTTAVSQFLLLLDPPFWVPTIIIAVAFLRPILMSTCPTSGLLNLLPQAASERIIKLIGAKALKASEHLAMKKPALVERGLPWRSGEIELR